MALEAGVLQAIVALVHRCRNNIVYLQYFNRSEQFDDLAASGCRFRISSNHPMTKPAASEKQVVAFVRAAIEQMG